MSELVAPDRIERIVGAKRRLIDHLGRAVSDEQTVYILHSKACKDSGVDLRLCEFSLALDGGIDVDRWTEDVPVVLGIEDGRLIPAGVAS